MYYKEPSILFRALWVAAGALLMFGLAGAGVIVVGPRQVYSILVAQAAPVQSVAAAPALQGGTAARADDATPTVGPRRTLPPTRTTVAASTPTATATATPTSVPSPTSTVTQTPVATTIPTPLPARVKVPILMYHYIRVNPDPTDHAGYALSVTPKNFEAQVSFLAKNGYHTIHFDQLVAYYKEGKPLPPKPVILTFDDAYRDFYTSAYPILKQYGQTGTVFVITEWVDRPPYLTSAQIQELAAEGIEFGGHTARHADMEGVDEVLGQREVFASKQALEALIGKKVVAFAYPSGRFNSYAISLLKKAGYQAAVTTQYGLSHTEADLFTLSRLRVAGNTTLAYLASQLQ